MFILNLRFWGMFSILLALSLAACGDATNTALSLATTSTVTTPATSNTVATATTAAVTTPSVTTAAAGSGPTPTTEFVNSVRSNPTTPAITTKPVVDITGTPSGATFTAKAATVVAERTLTAKAGTTPGNTPTVAVNGGDTLDLKRLQLPNAALVTVDPTLEPILIKFLALGNTNITDLSLALYTSTDSPAVLGENIDKYLQSNGYTFHDIMGGQNTSLNASNGDGVGAYTKPGQPDIILEARDAAALADPKDAPPGVDATIYQKFASQFNGKESALITLAGSGLYQSMTTSITATAAAPLGGSFGITVTPGVSPTK